MATWPADLPQRAMARGFQEKQPDLVVRTQMDVGPAKARRRATDGVTTFQMTLPPLTYAQAQSLVSFWKGACAGGALWFDWLHPRLETGARFRFVKPPVLTHIPGAALWDVSLELEMLP